MHPKPKPVVARHEQRPPDQMACPGCDVMVSRRLIACGPCWKRVPGELKAHLSATAPGTFGRARVVREMRIWLRANPDV